MAHIGDKHCSDSFKHFRDQLPEIDFVPNFTLYKYDDFWYSSRALEAARNIQSNFVARDDDIILTSSIKTGTTWLKALVFCIMQQQQGSKITADDDDDPLAQNHPFVHIPTLEIQTFSVDHVPDLSSCPSPRILHTHMPYIALPDSIKTSGCKIVYIVRNPKDTFVSMWHFLNTVKEEEIPLEFSFDRFCQGVHLYGPFFEHALQYWNESLKTPQKILFLKYEDLKMDTKRQVKRLASFLGRPLDDEEEIDDVISRCSIERLKNLEVNKSGVVPVIKVPKSAYFRLGVVGDWKNTLTPDMKDRLDQITKVRLEGTGLEFNA